MCRLTRVVTLLVALLICAALRAQTAPTTNLTLPAGAIKVTITAVQGIVQYRTGADAKWQKASEGVELNEGSELRTGPRSAVQFKIGDDQTVTLDRLGTIQILRANFENGKVFTDLGMKYGRTRYDIESAAREHDAKVRSPSSVLAVRGTKFIAIDQPPFAPSAVSLDGRVLFRDTRKLVAFGNKGQGKTKIDTQSDSAAKTALRTTTIIPSGKFTGKSDEETNRLIANSFGGGYENYGVLSLLGQARVQNFALVAVIAIEQLDIGLSWMGSVTSNVDIQVIEPNGTITDKNHTSNLRTYETSSPNNDLNPGFGQAIAHLSEFSQGTFTVNAIKTTKGPVTNVNVNATRDPASQFNDFDTINLPSFNLTDQQPSKSFKLKIEKGTPIQDVTPPSSSAIKTVTQSPKRK
jgi:hypothetical protein